jgi:hypothetical protein
MHPDWIQSDESLRCLGLTLSPQVTLGHVELLADVGSPLVCGGEVAPGDVATAVFILAWPAETSRKALRSRFTPLIFWLWPKLCRVSDWDEVAEAFCAWFAECIKSPSRIITTSAGSQSRSEIAAPWWVNQIAMAMSELGLSYAEATTMPARKVGQLVAAVLEARNQAEYETETRRNFIEQVKVWEAEKVRGN